MFFIIKPKIKWNRIYRGGARGGGGGGGKNHKNTPKPELKAQITIFYRKW